MESHLVLMLEQSLNIYMGPLIVIILASLRAYFFETHFDLLMVKCLALMKASKWDLLMVKCLVIYYKMYMESHLMLILEHSWAH